MAVDHDKKKVVISIRGTLSPKVGCLRLPAHPLQPLSGAHLPLPVLPQPSPVLSLHKDALTDLTGDAERLPVEGHHGTWLGHKVLFLLSAEAPCFLSSPTSTHTCPAVGVGALPSLLGPRGDMGQRSVDSSRRSTVAYPPGAPQSFLVQILSQKSLKRQLGRDWFL